MLEPCCCWINLSDVENLRKLDEPPVYSVSSFDSEKYPTDNSSDSDVENQMGRSSDLKDMKTVLQELAAIEGSSLIEQQAQLEGVLDSTLETDGESSDVVEEREEEKKDDDQHSSDVTKHRKEEPTETTEASELSFADLSEVETDVDRSYNGELRGQKTDANDNKELPTEIDASTAEVKPYDDHPMDEMHPMDEGHPMDEEEHPEKWEELQPGVFMLKSMDEVNGGEELDETDGPTVEQEGTNTTDDQQLKESESKSEDEPTIEKAEESLDEDEPGPILIGGQPTRAGEASAEAATEKTEESVKAETEETSPVTPSKKDSTVEGTSDAASVAEIDEEASGTSDAASVAEIDEEASGTSDAASAEIDEEASATTPLNEEALDEPGAISPKSDSSLPTKVVSNTSAEERVPPPKGEAEVQAILAKLSKATSPPKVSNLPPAEEKAASPQQTPVEAKSPRSEEVSDTLQSTEATSEANAADKTASAIQGDERSVQSTSTTRSLSKRGNIIQISTAPEEIVSLGDIVDTISPMPSKSFDSSVGKPEPTSTHESVSPIKKMLQQELQAKLAKKAQEAAAPAEIDTTSTQETAFTPESAPATPPTPQLSPPAQKPLKSDPASQSNSSSPSTATVTRRSFPLPTEESTSEFRPKSLSQVIRQDLWSPDSATVVQALQWITIETFHDDEARSKIARAGGLLAIVRCMDQHADDSAVQRAACQSLEKLALNEENEVAINDVGGVEAILNAMMGHLDDARVQEAAWSSLQNLTCQNAAHPMSVDAPGGMEALVSAMKGYSGDTSVQLGACGALGNLCLQNEGRMTELAASGGIVAMAMSLERHWSDKSVRKEISRVLSALLRDPA